MIKIQDDQHMKNKGRLMMTLAKGRLIAIL